MPSVQAVGTTALVGALSLSCAAQSNVPRIPQGAPTSRCDVSGNQPISRLRVLNGTAPITYVYDCGRTAPGVCLTRELNPLKPFMDDYDPVILDHTEGAWSCVSAEFSSGWLPSDRLAQLPLTPAIPTGRWLGAYATPFGGGDRLYITRSPAGRGIIHVSGNAHHTSIGHTRNIGQIDADAVAVGPYLHVVDGEPDNAYACTLDLKYNPADSTFRAVDNTRCGGFNVSFDGVWSHVRRRRK